MRRTKLLVFFAIASISLASWPVNAQVNNERPLLHVYASPSLATSLPGVLREYSKTKGIPISVECDNPENLIQNIVHGDAADLFLAESPEWFMRLKNQGMMDVYSQSVLMMNELVLTGPVIDPAPVSAEEQLKSYIASGVPVYTLPPETVQGGYTQAWLQMKVENAAIPVNYLTTPAELQGELLKGNAAVIAYKTEGLSDVIGTLSRPIPTSETGTIAYQGAVVAGEYMDEARDLLRFIRNPAMIDYFTHLGFIPVATPETERR